MEEIKWRFPGNNYTKYFATDTADTETFMENPISSLAREICQNSIDAKRKGQDKVIVEFETFTIKNTDIPDFSELRNEIEKCKEYKKDDKKDYPVLKYMSDSINQEYITCLRISDFNTTGLYGSKFDSLTKGSGISDKEGSTGGSKGIGKYASFVASSFKTVFYSTKAIDGTEKNLGIAILCSAPMEGTDQLTMGIGYYCQNNKNEPINTQYSLDSNYTRSEYGTDLYILGFKEENNWKNQMIEKILDSFLVAIYKGQLEIRVNDVYVKKDNLHEIILNSSFKTKGKKSITSQYLLISEAPGTEVIERNILDYGNVKIYARGFTKDDAHFATNSCAMIRYPYMMIKPIQKISALPCSAMCIIEDNKLNEMLKDIENPQHNNWEPNRIKEISLKGELKLVLSTLQNEIIDFVGKVLSTSQTDTTDIEGAGDYLPEVENESDFLGGEQQEKSKDDKPAIVKKRKNKGITKNPSITSQDDEGIIPDVGGHEDGDDSLVPDGNNSGNNGSLHGDNTEGSNQDGDADIIKQVPLTSSKRILFVSNKEIGEYTLILEIQNGENDCELEMYYSDDSGNSYKTIMTNCNVNGQNVEIKNNKAIRFGLKAGKNKIVMGTNLDDYYRCEVKVYANR